MAENPAIPSEATLFEPVRDTEGLRLALVFGNEAEGGQCPFYAANQCHHCDIGAGEGVQFTPKMNEERLRFFRERYRGVLETARHLVIYNSGSTLNPAELSRETLERILQEARSLPECSVVSFESREGYVTKSALEFLRNNSREDQRIRIILGVESQDESVRNGTLDKQMDRKKIERAFATAGEYQGKIGIDVNILFQPPGLTGEAAVEDAVMTLRYALDLGEKYRIPVNLNFHPYYRSKKSGARHPDHPRAVMEDAKEALRRMKAEIEARGSGAKLFIGWQDEEHDQESEIKKTELAENRSRFDRFNITQDVGLL